MRNNWEEKDIKPGRYIIRESSPVNSEDISFASSVTYKIGFVRPGRSQFDKTVLKLFGKSYALISITDGMTFPYKTMGSLVDRLNTDDYGYRPLTQEELKAQIEYLEVMNTGSR